MKSSQHTVPKYQQLAEEILSRLPQKSQPLAQSQGDLAREFAVHRLTIRHALDWLEKKGEIRREGGKTYRRTASARRSQLSRRIGLPIWANSIVDLDPIVVESRLTRAHKVHAELASMGFQLDLQCVGPSHSPDHNRIETLCESWDAVILEPMEGDNHLSSNHPFAGMADRTVVIGTLQGRTHNSVCPDFFQAGKLAVDTLVRSGARRILFTGKSTETTSHILVRAISVESTAATYPGVELLHAEAGFSATEAFSAVKDFFHRGGECDAIIPVSGYSAAGAMRAAADAGYQFPDQIQLVSMGGLRLASFMVPRPTIIRCESHHQSREIAKMAVHLALHPDKPVPNQLIPVHLVQGETSLMVSPEPVPSSAYSVTTPTLENRPV